MRRGFPFPVLRVFVLAAFGVVACIWAIRRAYRPKPPMIVAVPVRAFTADADADADAREIEIVAPDLLPPPETPSSARGRE